MTIEQILGWSKEEKIKVLCAACHLKAPPPLSSLCGWTDATGIERLSDPFDDLNVMHEVEKTLTHEQSRSYAALLATPGAWRFHSDAAARVDAFLIVTCAALVPPSSKDERVDKLRRLASAPGSVSKEEEVISMVSLCAALLAWNGNLHTLAWILFAKAAFDYGCSFFFGVKEICAALRTTYPSDEATTPHV